MPHAEIEDIDGNRLPIMSLVRPGQFLLIAGEEGGAWHDAAKQLAETHKYPVRAIRVGHLEGDYRDPRCTWLRHRQISSRGAVLVRPDRYVAWRRNDASNDPVAELHAVLSRTLCRPGR